MNDIKFPIIKDKNITKNNNTKKKTIRCGICRQKCNLICFECKCGGIFCSVHRYTHSHNCTYIEQKTQDKKKEIEKNNPKVGCDKVHKI